MWLAVAHIEESVIALPSSCGFFLFFMFSVVYVHVGRVMRAFIIRRGLSAFTTKPVNLIDKVAPSRQEMRYFSTARLG